jgi:hypothetical protein
MSHWREIQHIPDFNGKTVANIQFDGYEHFIIKFTDGTRLHIREMQQAGQITWEGE